MIRSMAVSIRRSLGKSLTRAGERMSGEPSHAPEPLADGTAEAGGDAPTGRYGPRWRPPDVSSAREAILSYDDAERFEFTGKQEAERILPHAGEDATVADIGCGIGRIALYMAPHCSTLWAVDVSDEMLSMARQRLADQPNVFYARCVDTRVPDIPSGSVDLAYSIIVLQHLEREDAFLLLEDIVRMLRRGGKAFITWPNITDPEYLESFVTYAHNGEAGHLSRARMYSTTELSVLLPRAGFRDVEVHDAPNIVTICTR
jgi:ubiquinone/menaquinone biosynthesis C-methylase UbiE